MTLKAPFPYFGGKSRVADLVWQRFGDVPNYVEPFFGSGAVLLSRPHPPRIETVNDIDAMLANFWRALRADPEAVAYWADWPVNEVDLHARHRWLVDRRAWVEELMTDPNAYDAQCAGWWVWGISQWIGSGWCRMDTEKLSRQRPGLSNGRGFGNGVHAVGLHRKRPHLMTAGKGTNAARISRQMRHLSDGGTGVHQPTRQDGIYAYFHALADRLRYVRVSCGDWTRVLGPSVTEKIGVTAIFLDPPYNHQERQCGLYAHDADVAEQVSTWALEHGNNPMLRIALCGYEDGQAMPGWTPVRWKAAGGYGSQSNGRGRENAHREVVWFSRHCLNELPLFAEVYL